MSDDEVLLDRVADALAGLPGVEAVALGGSRAYGGSGQGSDWDVALYYRRGFDPDDVRRLGWTGSVTDLGGWGPTFNGGGKLRLAGSDVDIDVHYRDLVLIEQIHEDAERGSYRVEPLLFHQAGLPSYIILAELGLNRTLRGSLPSWPYPAALRAAPPPRWWSDADRTLHYAREGHARRGHVAQTVGLVSEAACRTAHAILAARGQWVTNEKRLLALAGLDELDAIVAGRSGDADELMRMTDAARAYLSSSAARPGVPV